MEKLFTPGKWFVGFCAVFVCVFLAGRYVHDARLEEMSKVIAEDMFSYDFPELGIRSTCQIKEAHVLKTAENEAQVRVKGIQSIEVLQKAEAAGRAGASGNESQVNNSSKESSPQGSGAQDKSGGKTADCQALIKLYRDHDKWFVGSMEAE